MSLHHPGVVEVSITCVSEGTTSAESDELAVEEPLEIRVSLPEDGPAARPIAVTMRTPGNDVELAAGFLFTEGIIRHRQEIVEIRSAETNVVFASLEPGEPVDLARFERHSFVSSSCGVCGKRSIAGVFAIKRHAIEQGTPCIAAEIVEGLARSQRAAQPTFDRTGGLHAAALFDTAGTLLSIYEDVGRHNALDKLIGGELLAGRLPLAERIVFLSGRASFELIQKASVAGIPVVAAVGAPTSLAVELARQSGITLLGFVRDGRFNVYADAGRLIPN